MDRYENILKIFNELDDISKVDAIHRLVLEVLPDAGEVTEEMDDYGFRKNDCGDILCEEREEVEIIANFFDQLYGVATACTGYYDPEEDKRSGTIDECTGYHYVNFC